jgi:hypothetical protein
MLGDSSHLLHHPEVVPYRPALPKPQFPFTAYTLIPFWVAIERISIHWSILRPRRESSLTTSVSRASSSSGTSPSHGGRPSAGCRPRLSLAAKRVVRQAKLCIIVLPR